MIIQNIFNNKNIKKKMTTALVMARDVPYQVGRMAADIEFEFRNIRFRLKNPDSELLIKLGELERIAERYNPLQELDFVNGYEEHKKELKPVFRKSIEPDGGQSPVTDWLMYTRAYDV